MRLQTILIGLFLLGPTAHAEELLPLQNSAPTEEVTIEDLRRARAEAIAAARASCARQLQTVPYEDRLYYLMNECYKDNAWVFRPIEGVPEEARRPVNTGTPIFHPDPNDPRARR